MCLSLLSLSVITTKYYFRYYRAPYLYIYDMSSILRSISTRLFIRPLVAHRAPHSCFARLITTSSSMITTASARQKSAAFNLQQMRMMNRNARRPKRANHGKRPVSHARRREKKKSLKSRSCREKIFGFWYV